MTRYLLDRDVLGAVESRRGNRYVRAWIDTVRDDDLFVSVVTVMEARKGFARLRARAQGGSREAQIVDPEIDFDILLTAFADRVLPIDRTVADRWGEMLGLRDANIMDTAIAATAAVHRLVVATRNLRHFRRRGVRLIDPFKKEPMIEGP